ncbi:MAG: hypothetical protein KIS92_18950, partial [Planctomycetota bacterium]|nr:hypothetical protein [Planctomycetota bacterium]
MSLFPTTPPRIDRGPRLWDRFTRWLRYLAPTSRLLFSFMGLILAGAAMLWLPVSARDEAARLSAVDALFISTSAVCVTGLSTIDVGMRLSGFGQVVLLLLIQLGGLGFITLSTGLVLGLGGGKGSLLSRVALAETFSSSGEVNLRGLLRSIFYFTAVTELAGAVVLTWRIKALTEYDWATSAWYGVFHSVSAFCNAGFSLFSAAAGDAGDSLVGFAFDIWVNVIVMLLIILGGLGFLVVYDLVELFRGTGEKRRLGLHSRIVLATSAVLIFVGAALIFALEVDGRIFAGRPFLTAVMPSFFQSVTARTAGFNTVDIAALSSPTLLVLMVLMFVGGSPASCAGGVKTTTAFVLFQVVAARLTVRRHAHAFGREIGYESVTRAATLVLFSIFLVMLTGGTLMVLEGERLAGICRGGVFLDVLFE